MPLDHPPDNSVVPSPAVANCSPGITVALLTRNGMPALAQLLSVLREQKGIPACEIVALDSQSTDGSLEALRAAGAVVTSIAPANFSFGPARQQVFGLARGQVIVTLSQDAMPATPQWLAAMTGPILRGEFDLVQATEIAPDDQKIKLGILNCAHPYGHWTLPWSQISCAGLAISRRAWEQTGFGDAQMSEDHHLAMIAREKGFKMGFCTGVPMHHGHSYSLMGHIKRSFNEGMGARSTDGFYSLGFMLRDIFQLWRWRAAASAAIKYRVISLFEATWFPLRPIFIYIGWRFGKKYWR